MRFIGLAFVTLMTFISPASGTGFDQAVERYKAKEFQIAFAEFYELATDEHASAQVIGRSLHRSLAVVSGCHTIARRSHASIPIAHHAAQGNFEIARARGTGSTTILCGRIERL